MVLPGVDFLRTVERETGRRLTQAIVRVVPACRNIQLEDAWRLTQHRGWRR